MQVSTLYSFVYLLTVSIDDFNHIRKLTWLLNDQNVRYKRITIVLSPYKEMPPAIFVVDHSCRSPHFLAIGSVLGCCKCVLLFCYIYYLELLCLLLFPKFHSGLNLPVFPIFATTGSNKIYIYIWDPPWLGPQVNMQHKII